MEEEITKYKRSVGVVEADVEDGCIEHGVRGILKHKDIEKMIAEYDEEDKQARVHGKFHHLVGLIFKNFNRKIHVLKPFYISKKDFVVIEALDPHPRVQDAVLWLAVDRKGNKYVIDELFGYFKTRELAERVLSKADRFRLEKRIMDPLGFIEDKHQDDPMSHTLAARLSNYGLDYEKATKDRTSSDRRIKDALDHEMVGDEMLIAPELYIFDTCLRTIWELEHYQWDEWRGTYADRKGQKEKPMDKDDHQIENLGRLLVQEIPFTTLKVEPTSNVGVKSNKSFDPFD